MFKTVDFLKSRLKCLLLFIIIFFISNTHLKLFAQSLSIDSIYNQISEIYDEDQILVNGSFYENPYDKDLGHPFFLDNNFKEGFLIIHKKKYHQISLLYNIFNQTILLKLQKDDRSSPLIFTPPKEFISEFSIQNYLFKRYQFPNNKERFYQVIYNGEISCLYTWKKKRAESHHNVSFSAHKFYDAQKRTYLVINNELLQYKSKKDFLHLFPPEHKEAINKYIKNKKLKLKKSPDKDIADLIAYCEQLLND